MNLFKKIQNRVMRFKAGWNARVTYSSYKDALAACQLGYEDYEIISVVAKKTRHFIKALETMPQIDSASVCGMYSLLYCLFKKHKDSPYAFSVLDVGGACGANYFRIKALLGNEVKWRWHVVETPSMTEAGKLFTTSDELSFFPAHDIEKAQKLLNGIDMIYLSGSLQYMEDPIACLKNLLSYEAEYIYIGRLPLRERERIITVQKHLLSDNGIGALPEGFKDKWKAYPVTFVSKRELMDVLSKKYDVINEFHDNSGAVAFWNVRSGGFLVKKRSKAE
ncbi:MAG: methyltransferase, TIGR04325 family [Synergistaceae bacterium]|nr:methyltransferase, TIGR04325 family [Synergistaceae bacterium]